MTGYANVNDFIVILADDRDPDVSWQNHLDRGSAGGVDCVAPMRTPVYAPVAGRLDSAWLGTGGLTARIWQDDGWRDEVMHMDEVLPHRDVELGQLIGYSGDSGGDYDPHVHWHRVDPNGNRQNPWHYFTSSPAGGGSVIPNPGKVKHMQLAYIPKGASNGKDSLFLLFGERFYLEFIGQKAADAFNTQIGGNTAPASRSFFDAVARAQGITQRVEVVNLEE